MALICLFKVMDFNETFKVYVGGMKGMTDVAITLILAWSLGKMISGLGTAEFIVKFLQDMSFSASLVPAAAVPVHGRCRGYDDDDQCNADSDNPDTHVFVHS